MQVRNWLLAGGVSILLASCGDANTETETNDSTTVNTNTPGVADGNSQVRVVEPPVTVRTSFETKYPQAANVNWNHHQADVVAPIEWDWSNWTIDTSDYYANFSVNNEDYWVWYDEQGNWIGSVSEVNDHASLPSAVNQTVKSEFAGYTIESIDRENDKDMVAYEIDLVKGDDKMTALIAENGKLMKKKGKVDGEKIKVKNNPKDQ